jgi:hypothetical protein
VTKEEEARDQELRTQVASILRANRELGPQYEQIAVDQLMDVVRANAPADPPGGGRRGARAAGTPSRARLAAPPPAACQRGRSSGGPWWIWVAALIAAIHWGPALLRSSGLGSLSWIPAVLALVVFAKLVRLVTRWGRRLEASWDDPGTPPQVRSRSWG